MASRLPLQLGDGDARPGAGGDAAVVGLDVATTTPERRPADFWRPRRRQSAQPVLQLSHQPAQREPTVVHTTRRQPRSINELPTQNDVDSVLANSDWSSFTAALEELHDSVHTWVGGDMGV